MESPPVFISGDEVKRLLRYADLIPRLEAALAVLSGPGDSGVVQPVRSIIPLRNHNGFMGLMPAYMEAEGILCTKMVCFYKRGADSALPSTQATVLLLDPEHGNVKAIIDGHVITDMRTAATSAISAKYLMPAQAEVLAILGTGRQALSHYNVFTEIFSFKEVGYSCVSQYPHYSKLWSRRYWV
ncbi:Ketimine reductase mu-crystallin [Merluccius polli]|uniref:Ketimine reductase mu-crystallin n=1 Tax=Merluccius polli TaxID=89951 RepID=A0AA47P560_MERPO|nr:Ketimine reductase mu-crystallin [Merluccius polli]